MSEALAVATSGALPWVSAMRTAEARVQVATDRPTEAKASMTRIRCLRPAFIGFTSPALCARTREST